MGWRTVGIHVLGGRYKNRRRWSDSGRTAIKSVEGVHLLTVIQSGVWPWGRWADGEGRGEWKSIRQAEVKDQKSGF